MRIQLEVSFDDVIVVDNLLLAWQEFVRGKCGRLDVQYFQQNLMDSIIELHNDLANGEYVHGGYERFMITDPKTREIHKATVRDRLLNHAVHRILEPFFDRTFNADSFSCRQGKGTHAAGLRFDVMAQRVSKNYTKTCWVLKCDIRKFFASIDQGKLISILQQYITDEAFMSLLTTIIYSFQLVPGVGLPLGNLTSQLFVNVYMNEFDQFVKHKLKARHYIRYADDFVLLSDNREWLGEQILPIKEFLQDELGLLLHPNKVLLGTLASGVDWLGWIHFEDHKVPRTVTKQRMARTIASKASEATTQSYLGLLRHGNAYKLSQEVLNDAWLWSGM